MCWGSFFLGVGCTIAALVLFCMFFWLLAMVFGWGSNLLG